MPHRPSTRLDHALLALLLTLGPMAACRQPDARDPPAAPPAKTAPATARDAADPSAIRFDDATTSSGVVVRNVCGAATKELILEANGAGACWLDFDRDGRLDLYVVNGSTVERHRRGEPGEPNRLFRGRDDGTFTEVAAAAGADDRGWGNGCTVGDVDNDGWPDLFVTNLGGNRLWRNHGGQFIDATAAAGLTDPGWSMGAAFADIDSDGLLDLYVANYIDFDFDNPPRDGGFIDAVAQSCKWEGQSVFCGPIGLTPQADRLYRNGGDGRFVDVSVASGIAGSPPAFALAVLPFDYDDDGDVDLYVANDTMANYLWQNDGHGDFREVALVTGVAVSDTGTAQASMGLDAQDFDGDGRLDMVVTNFDREYNSLLRNLGNGVFADVSYAAGIAAPSIDKLGWGVGWFDFDNDADLDLFVVNGHVYPTAAHYAQNAQVFANTDGHLREVTDTAGDAVRTPRVGRGAAFADYDADGRVDVVVTNLDNLATVLHNTSTGGSWLEVELVGTDSNRDALGARVVVVRADGRELTRDLHSGGSYLSGNAHRVHFGLGGERAVRELRVRWPSGNETRIPQPGVDRIVRVREGYGEVSGNGEHAGR